MADTLANVEGRTREWIGPRIIPVFADEVQWDEDSNYEPLMMVQNQGETFMSRQYVPAGMPLPDTGSGVESTDYWVHMSNWNAQVEGYREEVMRYAQEVLLFDSRIDVVEGATTGYDATDTIASAISAVDSDVTELEGTLTGFDSTDTVKDKTDAIELDIDSIEGNVTELQGTLTGYDSTDTVKNAIDAVNAAIDKVKSSYYGVTPEVNLAVYVTLPDPPTDYYMNSIAYDGNNDILYIGYYSEGTSSILRRITSFSTYEIGDTISTYNDMTISNNHANSMSVVNGVVYIFEAGGSNVTKVASWGTSENIALGIAIVSAAVGPDYSVIRPNAANQIQTYIPFPNATNPFDGLMYISGANANVQWIQDSAIKDNCLFELFSDGVNPSYIEIYPYSTGSNPVTMPISFNAQTIEFEGITFYNNVMLIGVWNKIYYNRNVLDYKPQRTGGTSALYGILPAKLAMAPVSRANGIPTTYNSSDNYYTIKLPQAVFDDNYYSKFLLNKLVVSIQTIASHLGGTIEFDLSCFPYATVGYMGSVSGTQDDGSWTLFGYLRYISNELRFYPAKLTSYKSTGVIDYATGYTMSTPKFYLV